MNEKRGKPQNAENTEEAKLEAIATSNKCLTSSNRCIASSNKCIATNKKTQKKRRQTFCGNACHVSTCLHVRRSTRLREIRHIDKRQKRNQNNNYRSYEWEQGSLLGAKGIATRSKKLLGAPGLTTRSRKLLGAKGIAARSKDATRGSWPRY